MGRAHNKNIELNNDSIYEQLWSTFYWRRLLITIPIYTFILIIAPDYWFGWGDSFSLFYWMSAVVGYVVFVEVLISFLNCITLIFRKIFRLSIKGWYDAKLWFGRPSDRFGFLTTGLSIAAATWGVSKIAPEAEGLQWFALMSLYCLSWSIFSTAAVIVGRLESPRSALTP